MGKSTGIRKNFCHHALLAADLTATIGVLQTYNLKGLVIEYAPSKSLLTAQEAVEICLPGPPTMHYHQNPQTDLAAALVANASLLNFLSRTIRYRFAVVIDDDSHYQSAF